MRRSLAALPVLLLAVYLLRGVLLAPWLSGLLERAIEQRTGVRVTVGALEGSWIAGITVRSVRTVRPGTTGPLVSLEIDEMRAVYSPTALLGGIDSFVGSARIDVDGARVAVSLAPPQGGRTDDRDFASPRAEPAARLLPAVLPALRIRALDLTAVQPGLRIRAGGVSVDSAGAKPGGAPEVSIAVAALTAHASAVALGPLPLSAGLRGDGQGLRAEFSLPGRGARGTLAYADGRIDTRLVLEAVALAGVLTLPEGSVSGTLSGEAHLQTGAGREPAVTLSARLVDGIVRGIPLQRLEVEAALASGTLRISALEAVAGANRVTLADVVVPPHALGAGDPAETLRAASGSFTARLGDLPALLALAGRPLALPKPPPSHRLDLAGSLGGGIVSLTEGRLALARGGLRVRRFRAALPAAAAPWSSTRLEADIEIDLPDIALLNGLLPLPKLAGSLAARVVVEGTPETLQGSLRATARRLAVAGRAIGDLDLAAESANGRLLVRTARIAHGGGANRLSLDGLALSTVALVDRRWQALLREASGDFAADARDLPGLLALAGVELPVRDGSPPPAHRLRLAGRIDGGRITLASGELAVAGGTVRLSRARVALPPEGRPWDATGLDLAAAIELPDLAPLAALLGLQPLGGRLRASAELRGTVAAPEGVLDARVEALAVGGLHGFTVALSAAGGRDLIRVANLDVRRGADFCTASGAYAPARGRLEAAAARFRIAQASAYGGLLPATWPALFGRIEGQISVSGPTRDPEGTFAVAVDDLFLGAAGAFRGSVSGTLSGGGIDIARLTLEAPQGSLALEGRLEREGARGARMRLGALVLRRGASEARLERAALLRITPAGNLVLDEIRLSGPQGSLTLRGTLAPQGDSDFSFAAAGLGTDGWLSGAPGARVFVRGLDVRGRFTGSRARPAARIEGSVGALGGVGVPHPLAGRFDLAYQPGALTVAAFEWSDGNGLRASAAGRLPLDPLAERPLTAGALDFTARLSLGDLRALSLLLPPSVALSGSLEADLTLGGTWENPTGRLAANATQAGVSGVAALQGIGPFSAALAAVLRDGTAEVQSLNIAAEELRLEAAGTWAGMPTPGELLRGDRPARTGTLALRGSFAAPDLARLRTIVGSPRRLEGRLGGTFTVAGPAADPAVDAEFRLDGGALDYGGRIPALERIVVAAKATGHTVRIVQASGEAAGAPFRLGGEVSWGGEGLRLDLVLNGENVLLYRDERVTARADLDLRARGPLAALRLEGGVQLQNGTYTRTITLPELLGAGGRRKPPSAAGPLFTLREPPWRDLQFDLRIGSGSPFAIRTNLVRGAVRPDLTLTGTGLLPVLAGNVFVDPTHVSLPVGTLGFQRGIVTYPPQGAGEPRIDLAGSTRLLGYDVTVRVGGSLASPEVTLTSIPPLANEELLLLVLAGTPPGTADAQALKRILEATLARFIAQSLISGVTGGAAGEDGLADRIEVEVGRNITRSGLATIETRFRLLGGTAPTGGTLQLVGGTDIYDAYTMGVTLVFHFR